MILPTMNDEEKVFEAVRMSDWLCSICDDLHEQVVEKFKKGTRFPYFQRCRATDDKNNNLITKPPPVLPEGRRKAIRMAFFTFHFLLFTFHFLLPLGGAGRGLQ